MNDPETFVINLDDRTDRWDAIQKLCSGAGLTPRRISAVRATPGWIGCTYSHMKCMQIAKEEQLPWVLILEDDATFTPASFNRFRMLLPFLW